MRNRTPLYMKKDDDVDSEEAVANRGPSAFD
jgi:hypothetical protein